MYIDIHTDAFLDAEDLRLARVKDAVECSLRGHSADIAWVDILLGQAPTKSTGRSGQRCCIEAGLRGRQPLLVEHEAESLDLAVDGALDKLARVIQGAIERSRDRLWSGSMPASEPASPAMAG